MKKSHEEMETIVCPVVCVCGWMKLTYLVNLIENGYDDLCQLHVPYNKKLTMYVISTNFKKNSRSIYVIVIQIVIWKYVNFQEIGFLSVTHCHSMSI